MKRSLAHTALARFAGTTKSAATTSAGTTLTSPGTDARSFESLPSARVPATTSASSARTSIWSYLPKSLPDIDRAIAESRSTWADPDNPEVWERYDTAARVYAALGRDPGHRERLSASILDGA